MAKKSKSKASVVPLSPRKKRAPRANGSTVSASHNGGPDGLSQEQRDKIALQKMEGYEGALAKKKKADADFKNYCKQIIADLGKGGVKLVKDMIALKTDEGEAEMRSDIQRHYEASRIMGAGLATQLDMFAEADAKAKRPMPYREGFAAGYAGEPAKTPSQFVGDEEQEWLSGHHDGNAKLAKGIKKKTPKGEQQPEASA